MNEAERISSLEKRLNDVESILDKICRNTDVCGYTERSERSEHEEGPLDRFKKGL